MWDPAGIPPGEPDGLQVALPTASSGKGSPGCLVPLLSVGYVGQLPMDLRTVSE